MLIKRIEDPQLSDICKQLGILLTGSEITAMFKKIDEIPETELEVKSTKWKRIHRACSLLQNKYNNGNKIIEMIEYVMTPSRFVPDIEKFESSRTVLNHQLSFIGLTLTQSGKIQLTKVANTIQESKEKIDFLKSKMEYRNIHPKIIQFCKVDIINEDYFSLIFESSKCIYDKIREMTGLTLDGNKLIYECFDDKYPVIIFNKMETQSEKDEYAGFRNFLISLGKMFRNPKAHDLKFFTYTDLDECLDILTSISLALKKLDKCSINQYALYNKIN